MSDRRPWLIAMVVLASVTAACGGGSKSSSSKAESSATTEAPSTTVTAAGGPNATTATTGASSGGPTSGGGSSSRAVTTRGAGSSSGGTSSGSTSSGTSTGGGPAPARAGTYRMRQSGSTTIGTSTQHPPPEGTLKIDPGGADGKQVWHRVVDPNQASNDTTLAFRSDGMFIVQTVLRQGSGGQQLTFTCNFDPGIPAPPWPPAVGKTYGGHGDCGSFTTDVSGRITGSRQVALDGKSIEVFVAETTITTHGQLESTGRQVNWFAPSLRLSVHDESHQKGSYGPFGFSSDGTSDLISAKPA